MKDQFWSTVDGIDMDRRIEDLTFRPDVVVDFSHPSSICMVLEYCTANKLPLVIGTTGHDSCQLELIGKAAKNIPILKATNMSLGMNIVFSVAEEVARMLKDKADIEVLEAHHNRKKDAPSGSAISIIQAIEKGLGEARKHQQGRIGECLREKGEIGVHAIRGGNIVGYHEVNFINDLETVKIVHEAHDRAVFAQGALDAAKYLIGKANGLYGMKNVLGLN
jgi:4-hydroxy-tetrahydrodipicolinate reductase